MFCFFIFYYTILVGKSVEWKENRKVKKLNDLGNDGIRTKRKMANEHENKECLIAYLVYKR